jgi:hypothetical protein
VQVAAGGTQDTLLLLLLPLLVAMVVELVPGVTWVQVAAGAPRNHRCCCCT